MGRTLVGVKHEWRKLKGLRPQPRPPRLAPTCQPAGQAGGSAISPEGWRFMICADQERCKIDPTDGISRWYR